MFPFFFITFECHSAFDILWLFCKSVYSALLFALSVINKRGSDDTIKLQ